MPNETNPSITPEPNTCEHCCLCDEETGRAGRYDDSLYCDDCDAGPFCEVCDEGHDCKNKQEPPMPEPKPPKTKGEPSRVTLGNIAADLQYGHEEYDNGK